MMIDWRLTEQAWKISFIIVYSLILVWLGMYVGSLSNLSVLGWVPVIVGLTPLAVTTDRAIRKRSENYRRLLMDNRIGFWDIDETIDEYLALFHK